MDGTALYVGIVTVFGAQAFNIDLSLTDYLLVAGRPPLYLLVLLQARCITFLMAAVMDTIGMTLSRMQLSWVYPCVRPSA